MAEKHHIDHVLNNMQEIEVRGLDAVMWGGYQPEVMADMLMAQPVRYAAVAEDGEPVVIGGVTFKTPAMGEAWMWGTERWPEVYREVTRATRTAMHDLLANELRRIDVLSLDEHRLAHKWYQKSLGMRFVCELEEYGAGGESFYLFTKTRRDC